ncbi:MAG: peptide-methionine (R)-S-oxide reductase MsrB [Verrucomicrobiota bacterium]
MKHALSLLILITSLVPACAEDKTNSSDKDKAMTKPAVTLSEADWKKRLTEEQYRVTRTAGTERPNGAEYEKFNSQGDGTYYCVCCGVELFTSSEKFHSGCGWPSFYDQSKAKNVKETVDPDGHRVEVTCKRCDAHLGHVFEGEGFKTPTNRRFCINGVAMKFVEKGGEAPKLLELGSAAVEKKKEEVAKEAGVEVKKKP